MSFSATVLAPWSLALAALLAVASLMLAGWQAPWRTLVQQRGLQHRLLGATVCALLLWQLRAQAVDWLTLHLMLSTLLTLVFGAPLALLSLAAINVGMVLVGKVEWSLLGVNYVVTAVIPVLIAHGIWRGVDRFLPNNYFIYIFLCGFFGAALSLLGTGIGVIVFAWLGSHDPTVHSQVREYALFLPMLLPSEAFISGMLLSIMAAYHPDWVRTFDAHRYLDTK
ncbi:energy-coupling factor ABC transporter permease [Halomonas sp. WWR20]